MRFHLLIIFNEGPMVPTMEIVSVNFYEQLLGVTIFYLDLPQKCNAHRALFYLRLHVAGPSMKERLRSAGISILQLK